MKKQKTYQNKDDNEFDPNYSWNANFKIFCEPVELKDFAYEKGTKDDVKDDTVGQLTIKKMKEIIIHYTQNNIIYLVQSFARDCFTHHDEALQISVEFAMLKLHL